MITLEYTYEINVQLQMILLKVILFLTFKWKLYTYKFYCQFISSPQSQSLPLKHLYSYAVEFKVSCEGKPQDCICDQQENKMNDEDSKNFH